MSTFISTYKRKIEMMEMDTNSGLSVTVLEALGNQFLMLNGVQQMQHQYQWVTDTSPFKNEEFVLADEVKYIVQGFSLSMNPRVTLRIEYEQNLPQRVSGNLEKFRLAMMIALDFAIKYIC